MTCNYCQSTALYKVGAIGYCKTHRELAVNLRKSLNVRRKETRDVFWDQIIDEKERRLRAVRRMQNGRAAMRKRLK